MKFWNGYVNYIVSDTNNTNAAMEFIKVKSDIFSGINVIEILTIKITFHS